MDKNAIKKYAVWAREQLIEKVTARAVKYEIVDGQKIRDKLEAIKASEYLYPTLSQEISKVVAPLLKE